MNGTNTPVQRKWQHEHERLAKNARNARRHIARQSTPRLNTSDQHRLIAAVNMLRATTAMEQLKGVAAAGLSHPMCDNPERALDVVRMTTKAMEDVCKLALRFIDCFAESTPAAAAITLYEQGIDGWTAETRGAWETVRQLAAEADE